MKVRARAADDPALLVQSPWLPQPLPYLRSDGAELAWYDPWVDLRAADGSLPDGTGTFELLFQQVTGRFVEVELCLRGGGRSSPAVRSLRAWYPRFSYPEHYLPAVYREDAAPYGFLDRFLANFEGFYTVAEERIEHSSLLLDARTVPPDDLAWLASWFGLVLDPQWNELQRRFLVRNVDRFYRCRGTLGGLLAILRAYLDPQVDDSVFDCSCTGTSGLRIVEQFLTRDGGGAAHGDPAATARPRGGHPGQHGRLRWRADPLRLVPSAPAGLAAPHHPGHRPERPGGGLQHRAGTRTRAVLAAVDPHRGTRLTAGPGLYRDRR